MYLEFRSFGLSGTFEIFPVRITYITIMKNLVCSALNNNNILCISQTVYKVYGFH